MLSEPKDSLSLTSLTEGELLGPPLSSSKKEWICSCGRVLSVHDKAQGAIPAKQTNNQ